MATLEADATEVAGDAAWATAGTQEISSAAQAARLKVRNIMFSLPKFYLINTTRRPNVGSIKS
jgi:hypothetical protein